MQDRPGGHEIEAAGIDGAGDDIALPQLEFRRADVDERQVEIDGDDAAARTDPIGEPGRHRAVAAADFERPSALTHAERLDAAAVHRVEQSRHQRQARALTIEMVIQDVLTHGSDATTADGIVRNPGVACAYTDEEAI